MKIITNINHLNPNFLNYSWYPLNLVLAFSSMLLNFSNYPKLFIDVADYPQDFLKEKKPNRSQLQSHTHLPTNNNSNI